jgi:hypothetical protein
MEKEAARLRDQELRAEGWEWRFCGNARQTASLEETYASLGMETLIERGVLGNGENCRSCFDAEGFAPGFETLYTRGKARENGRFDDDLFGE